VRMQKQYRREMRPEGRSVTSLVAGHRGLAPSDSDTAFQGILQYHEKSPHIDSCDKRCENAERRADWLVARRVCHSLRGLQGGRRSDYGCLTSWRSNSDRSAIESATGDEAAHWQEASDKLKDTTPLAEVETKDFDAVFLPGGHGTMFDFPDNAELMRLLRDLEAARKPIAAVCHAPAALVTAVDSAGALLVRGKTVTGFTDSEERAVKLEDQVPFLLETRLRELEADFKAGPDFQPHTERTGLLITGQNPASSKPAADLLLSVLSGQ